MIARATVSSPREIHPTSIVSPEARVGRDVTIGPYVVIHANVSLGDGSFVDSHALVGAPTGGRGRSVRRRLLRFAFTSGRGFGFFFVLHKMLSQTKFLPQWALK